MAAAAFSGGQSRLTAGCGQNCPPHGAKSVEPRAYNGANAGARDAVGGAYRWRGAVSLCAATVTVDEALLSVCGFQTVTVSWSPAARGHIPF